LFSLCSSQVTHLITEFKDIGAVLRKLGLTDMKQLGDSDVVSVQWFTECMKAGKVVEVEDRHKIQPAAV